MSEKTKITKTISKKVNMDAITYRRKMLSKTRTVDLKTLTSKLDNLDPEVELAILDQIERYLYTETQNTHYAEKLVCNEGVYLPEHTFLHGLRYNIDLLRDIKNNGILAGEYYDHGDVTHGMADFWRLPEDTLLVDFIDRVQGKLRLTSEGRVDLPLSKTQLVKGGTTTSTEEKYFLNFDKDGIAFIIDPDVAKYFAKYDYYNDSQNRPKALEKLVDDKNSANGYLKGRRSAILVGIPYSCFSGVIVGTSVSSDPEKLQSIIDLFGNDLMIIAGDGQVLSVPKYAQKSADIDRLNECCSEQKHKLLEQLPEQALTDSKSNSLMQWLFGKEIKEIENASENY